MNALQMFYGMIEKVEMSKAAHMQVQSAYQAVCQQVMAGQKKTPKPKAKAKAKPKRKKK